jgi:carboxylesterase type B
VGDCIIGFGVHRLVNLLTDYVPVYYYEFSYLGRYSHLIWHDMNITGAAHQDDLLYTLVLRERAPVFDESDPENEIVKSMTSLWTNFTVTG